MQEKRANGFKGKSIDFECDVNIAVVGSGGFQCKLEKAPAMPGIDVVGYHHLMRISAFCEALLVRAPSQTFSKNEVTGEEIATSSPNYDNAFSQYMYRYLLGEEL